jgi:exosortase C (VPDSG-CTERM-specific)
MNQSSGRITANLSPKHRETGGAPRVRIVRFLTVTAILILCFIWPLFQLVRFSLHRDLYSHILLIPFISFYLFWERRKSLPKEISNDRAPAILFSLLGLASVVGILVLGNSVRLPSIEDSLALEILGLVFLFIAICFWFLGRPIVRELAFPLGFLLLMAPFPVFLMDRIVSGLQLGSAAAADVMFDLVGTPVVYHGLRFQLPDITIEVAPECSGIHSSLALLITSLVAAFLFLRSPWKRVLFVLSVIPLAIIRNGFRIFTIGELCVHYGAQMINSYIHHHGGPIFFAVSLIPFFALLILLSKSDRRCGNAACNPSPSPKT